MFPPKMIHTEGKFAFCAGVLGPGAACLLSGVILLEEEHSKIFFNLSEKRSNYINRFCMYFCSNNLKVVGKKTESSEIFVSSPENAPAPVQRAAVAGTMSSLRSGILSRWCLLVIIDRVRDQPDR